MHIAITGSNGFIGNTLVQHFIKKGHDVLLLQRKAPEQQLPGTTWQLYDLCKSGALPNLNNVDALVHTAYIPYQPGNNARDINIRRTMNLYELCLSKGIYFIFLSSMSAHSGALSEYGKHKFELENKLDTSRCLVLKPGLVIGNQGLFSRIKSALQKLPVMFLVGGGAQPLQPVFIDDLVKVIDESISLKRTGKYYVATSQVYTMRQLVTAIATHAGKKPLLLSVPYGVVNFGIALIELLHLPFPVSKENLLGLKQLKAVDTSEDLRKLNLIPLNLHDSVERL